MLFFRKKQGLRSNFFRRLYNRYSVFLPLIAMFSLGIFGTSIYYKNQPVLTTGHQASYSTKVKAITNQLNSEKDITDSLSDKNIELKKQLKDALSQATNNDESDKITKLNSELEQEKQQSQKLNNENARLKVRINNMLAQTEAIKNTVKRDNNEVVAKTTKGNRNTAQVSNEKVSKDKNFNKVKMDLAKDSKAENNAERLTNRNSAQKITKKDEEVTAKKVIKSSGNRTMKLKKGESLWNLSKRAYGKGIYYKKIIKANPSITEKSFKRLRPGTRINVPL